MTSRTNRVHDILEKLGQEAGFRGALLVTRDGLTAVNPSRGLAQAETLSAMCAAIVGASEAALAEWNELAPARIVIETPGVSLVLVGISSELLLVAATEPGASPEKVRPLLDAAAASLTEAVRR